MIPLLCILGWPLFGVLVCGLLWRGDCAREREHAREYEERRQHAVDLRAKALCAAVILLSRANALIAREACLAVALVDAEWAEDEHRYRELAASLRVAQAELVFERQREMAVFN